MCRASRTGLIPRSSGPATAAAALGSLLAPMALLVLTACQPTAEVEEERGADKSPAAVRAERRLFDGAPPVIPHVRLGAACISCHNEEGMSVPDLGFSPPSPHELTAGLSAISRCEQCHVFSGDAAEFVDNDFVPLRQDLRRGERLSALAPPVMPHGLLMRENCRACHTGPAAREEIRTTHPERLNCSQCHVEQVADDRFAAVDARRRDEVPDV